VGLALSAGVNILTVSHVHHNSMIRDTVKVFRIKDTLKETQRISAHKYRIVQGGEYSTPTLNMRKYRSLKKHQH
jgi:UDP-N-acetylmuramyl pentapeptide synthase